MAKGQKQLQDTATQQSQQQYQVASDAQKRLVDGSPEFQGKKAQIAADRAAINNGTISDQSDFVDNRANVADREAKREATANLTQSGVAGLASNYADPTKIALAKQLLNDEWSRDSASQQETDAANYIDKTNAAENDIVNTEVNSDANVMGTAFGVSQNNQQLAAQIASQRASVLPSIIGMALGAAGQVASSGASTWFTPKSAGTSAAPHKSVI